MGLWEKKFRSSSSFEFLRHLGTGGSAHLGLYRRWVPGVPPQDVVIKIMRNPQPEALAELINEWQTLNNINHPNIVTSYGYERIGEERLGLVLEYVEGSNLADLIPLISPLDREELAFYLAQTVGEVLRLVHSKRFVHGDLSARNILISKTGDIKVGDFGLSRHLDHKQASDKGSFDYLAPERWEKSDATRSADIFSYGVLIYEVLTGVNPLRDESLGNVKERSRLFSISKKWDHFGVWSKFFDLCLALNPQERKDFDAILEAIPKERSQEVSFYTNILSRTCDSVGQKPLGQEATLPLSTFFSQLLPHHGSSLWERFGLARPLAVQVLAILLLLPFVFFPGNTSMATVPQCQATLTSEPWGKIWVDGHLLGFTPIVKRNIACGSHVFEWESRDQRLERRVYNLVEGVPFFHQFK